MECTVIQSVRPRPTPTLPLAASQSAMLLPGYKFTAITVHTAVDPATNTVVSFVDVVVAGATKYVPLVYNGVEYVKVVAATPTPTPTPTPTTKPTVVEATLSTKWSDGAVTTEVLVPKA